MDYERAEQVVESLGVINVTYKNAPVWIEYIEREKGTAHIKNLEMGEHKEVLISSLNEENVEKRSFQ